MSVVGNVKREKDGRYSGRLTTMTINVPIEIAPVKDKETEKHPDFRIFCTGKEVGAAWNRKGERSGKPYVSCKIETPEMGLLFFNIGPDSSQDDPDVMALYWNAPKKKGLGQ